MAMNVASFNSHLEISTVTHGTHTYRLGSFSAIYRKRFARFWVWYGFTYT